VEPYIEREQRLLVRSSATPAATLALPFAPETSCHSPPLASETRFPCLQEPGASSQSYSQAAAVDPASSEAITGMLQGYTEGYVLGSGLLEACANHIEIASFLPGYVTI